MTCDSCGDRLRDRIALAEGLRALARSGTLQVVISDRFVTHAAETGLRVREYAPAIGEGIQCTVSADDDLLVARLAAELGHGVAGRSVVVRSARRRASAVGGHPVRADAGSVIFQQSISWAKASPTTTMIARLLAVDASGGERVLGEYAFHHTRTIPGPPGW